jgi:hypothetical protein
MLLYDIRMRGRDSTPCVMNFVWHVKRRVVSLLPTYSLDDSSQPASHIHTLARTHSQTHIVLFLEKILESGSDSKYMQSLSVISPL